MRGPLLVAVLLALGGCLGGTGVTGAPDAADPPAADWADEDGIDAGALARSHFATLREAGSFTVNRTETVRVGGEARPDGPRPEGYYPPRFTRRHVSLDANRSLRVSVTVGNRRSARFVTPEIVASRRLPCATGDCEPEYAFDRRPPGDTLARSVDRYRRAAVVERLARSLRGLNYTYDGRVERGGETLHRYGANATLDSAPPPFSEPPRGTATLLVTDEGVIRRFDLRYSGVASVETGGTRSVDVAQAFVRTYAAVGETPVDRPAWVDRAAAAETTRTTETGEA
jgi:hypothetical protein